MLALVVVTSLPACARTEPEHRFELTGTVGVREAPGSRVIIAHDPVEGLMPAMSMPFEIRGGTPGLREGDRIAATLVVTSSRSWVENVRITGAGSAAGNTAVSSSHAAPGVVVPDFALVNQDGKSLRFRDFAGRGPDGYRSTSTRRSCRCRRRIRSG